MNRGQRTHLMDLYIDAVSAADEQADDADAANKAFINALFAIEVAA